MVLARISVNAVRIFYNNTSRVPVEGKSSVCLICMKYTIIFLIIIIISLGQILLSYIANTSRTHARTHARAHARTHARTHALTHARTHAHTHSLTRANAYTRTHSLARTHTHTHTHPIHTPPAPYRYSMGLCQPTVTARSAGDNSWSLHGH